MKFPESWLREFVDPAASRDELCAALTMAGLEVEGVTPIGAALDGVVVAEIVEAEKHPNADKLRVCKVSTGQGEPVQIVCGAPNARAGLKAPLATVGATLPGGLVIKAAKLRGVESFGMLCSGRELAMTEDSDGLLELPADATVGQPVRELLALPDATLELKLTPNRPDCLGLRGLASEVATLFGAERKSSTVPVVPATIADTFPVRLDAPADCPRYCGRVIRGVDPKAPSPLWMTERLRRSGLRSISAIVDCTNYVMLELGQALHAFDLGKLSGGIVVRRGHAGEKLNLLDGRTVEVDGEFVVIADANGGVALGGVMGGLETKVTDDTVDLFIEAAHFTPASIIGRARRLGMHTDASHRFERGVDPESPRLAIERITALLLALVGGQAGPLVEACEPAQLPVRKPVRLRSARASRVLGIDLADERIEEILRGLDMQVSRIGDAWEVTPPSRRFDVEIEEDLIEELARIHGYDRIPVAPPRGQLRAISDTESAVDAERIRATLAGRGYAEAINFSFVGTELLTTWKLDQDIVALANPLSADIAVMRTALLPGLVEAVKRNQARQQQRVRLFETGKVFSARPGSAPLETLRIAGVLTGGAVAEQWGERSRGLDFFDLKGDVEVLLGLRGTGARVEFAASKAPWLHPGRSAEVRVDGAVIGQLGALHPRLAAALDTASDTLVFELDLIPLQARQVPKATGVSAYPSVRRDIAVVISNAVSYAAVAQVIEAAGGAILRRVVLFDEYRGQGLAADSRSLAIGLILQDDSRTLTDAEVDAAVNAALAALKLQFGAVLRS